MKVFGDCPAPPHPAAQRGGARAFIADEGFAGFDKRIAAGGERVEHDLFELVTQRTAEEITENHRGECRGLCGPL